MRASNAVIRLSACLGAALLLAAGTIFPALTANAAGARVSVSQSSGLNPNGQTKIKLHGSGFQSVKGGFGGVYVLFGWVSSPNGSSWRPSKGGTTGGTYRYVSDNEDNPAGYEVFVSFPGGSTESAANGGVLKANGTWNATIKVPGAKFTSVNRSGKRTVVDCLKQQCGIITVGAHGVKNAHNETFTPLQFKTAGATAAVPKGKDNSGTGASASANANKKSTAAKSATDSRAQEQAAASESAAALAAGASPTNPATVGIAPTQDVNNTPLLTTILWSVAILIAALTLMVLAAGVGGYLASKSILLGVSPRALAKEKSKRDAAAAALRRKAEFKEAKREAKHQARIASVTGVAAQMRQPLIDTSVQAPATETKRVQLADAQAQSTGATGTALAQDDSAPASSPAKASVSNGTAAVSMGGFFANRVRSHSRNADNHPTQRSSRA